MKTRNYIPEEKFATAYIDDLSFSDLQVIALGYEKNEASRLPMSSESMRHFSLHFVLSGVGYYETKDKIYRLTRNSLFLIYPNSSIKYYPDKKHPWTYTWINFTGSKALKFLGYTTLTFDNPVSSFKSAKIGNILLRSLHNIKKKNSRNDFRSLYCFYEVINEIIHSHPTTAISQKQKDDVITLALNFITQNYSNPDLTLKSLSNYLHLNSSYLSRILKQRTGSTFTDFLTSLRIQNAIKLMESGLPYVNEISRKVGFSDPYYFSKTFKKYAHTSPKFYIQELRNKTTYDNPPPIDNPKDNKD